jgi:tetratricopeptide (TPR) repeat protein
LLNQISSLWFGSNAERQQAFDLLERNRLKCTMLPEFIARLAHSLSKRAVDLHDEFFRKSMLHEALELSKMALKSNENCALCHFSYGHIIGVLLDKNEFALKDKLKEASLFKYHMEKTIELDRNFSEAYAYLGRYEYTAFNLSLFERKAVSMLGYRIEGNLDKALEYLHIASKGNCDMIHTVYLLIGKIYQKKKQYIEAKKYLNMCLQIPTQRKSQTEIVNEAKVLLKDKKIENSSFETFCIFRLKKQNLEFTHI